MNKPAFNPGRGMWAIVGEGLEAARIRYSTADTEHADALAFLLDPEHMPECFELFAAIATADECYRDLSSATIGTLLRKPESRARLLKAAREKRAEMLTGCRSYRVIGGEGEYYYLEGGAFPDPDELRANAKLISALLCFDAYFAPQTGLRAP